MRRSTITVLLLAIGASLLGGPAEGQEPEAGVAEEPEAALEVMVVTEPGTDAPTVAAAAAADVGGELAAELAIDGVAVVEVPAGEVAALERQPGVVDVLDGTEVLGPAIHRSVPFVGAPSVWASGVDGSGQVVVVIDTGVDPANTAVAPAVVGEACFTGFGSAVANCRAPGGVGPLVDHSEGALTATPCSLGAAGPYGADCIHGTAVAATAVSRSATRPGVARGAGLYAIQVFNSAGTAATVGDLLLALDHVVDLVDGGMDVAAVNLSLASSNVFPGHCDGVNSQTALYRDAFAALAARGVPVVAATGNSGASGISTPACVSNAVAVGATTVGGAFATFTNRSSALDLLAPGAGDTSASGLTFPGTVSMAGTSFAAPHVAGAMALVRQQFPLASAADLTGHLLRLGVPVTVPGVGARPRLRVLPVPQALHAGALFSGTGAVGGGSRVAAGDFDGDGRADVLSHGPGSTPDRVSYGRSSSWGFAAQGHGVSGSYVPLVGNFRGGAGGPDDILWYAPGPAGDSLWAGSGSRAFDRFGLSISGSYLPLVGNFDGDGHDDVLWYAPGAAPDFTWFGGAGGFTSVPVSVAGAYRAVVGDFDGDGADDVFWHAPGAATDHLWEGSPGRSFASSSRSIGGSYVPFAGDLDGDGRDDIVWYAPGPAADYVHYGNADGSFASVQVGATGAYQPFVADVDGDGRDDVVWYAPGSTPDSIWFGNPGRTVAGAGFSVSGTYQPAVGDWDGDGADDIAWHTSATTVPVWWSAG